MTWDIENKVFKKNPEYCILYGGLPDILLQAPMERILKSYKELCEMMKEKGILPIIVATLPVSGHAAVNAKITLLNQQLMNYVAMNNIAWVDCSNGLAVDGKLKSAFTRDGYFLNEKGKSIFAHNIAGFMNDVLLLKDRKVASDSVTEYIASESIETIIRNSPSKVNIVMLGNSITEGGKDWNKWLERNDVRNAGKGGFTSGQLLWFLDTCVISAHPKYCFIMSGINDLFQEISFDIIYENQVILLNRLMANGITPVVFLTLYRFNDANGNRNVDKVNSSIANYCKGNNIECIDLNPYLSDETGLKKEFNKDGTHINDKGYEIWSKIVRDFLKKKRM